MSRKAAAASRVAQQALLVEAFNSDVAIIVLHAGQQLGQGVDWVQY